MKSEDHRKNFFLCLSTAVCGSFLVYNSGNIPLSLPLPTSMARGLTFTTVGLTVLTVLVLVHPTCCAPTAMVNHTCSASSCGNIHNISFPFRLKTDPENCGYPGYELSCENDRTVLYISGGKYYVQEISYNNYTIRIVDSGLHKDNYFFSTPTYPSSRYYLNFYSPYYTYLRKGTKVNFFFFFWLNGIIY